MQSGIGAAGGVIAAPISFAGGAIVGASSAIAGNAAAQAGVIVTADLVGGVAAGAGTKMIANAYDGRELSEGVLHSAVVSGMTGGLVSGAGVGANQILDTVTNAVGKIVIQTTAGALISGTSGGLGCLLHNVINKLKIDREELKSYLVECGASEIQAALIWDVLYLEGYITNDQFTPLCD